ncbi:D-erythronate dehydrogenase [Tanticharoenia sakaeratensis]|uniref:NAD-dependent epimerase/dehydratase n=1 Tax=Tanticharoenia sakaeratensis NBRC 103193 TaxID=1231623 RepID=A0A0D6MLZ1_9PROT|nr:D-erythronate dehydrogenase [Tanticharoenia sakaeratensis]GAN54435.1 NAD-dependent epimerase/dehydratase [Tanticharoenia sakaeratensis NBRC 103193]GBQ24116.1 nucleoside-diphosphate-sugar epimerase [Tanticharoenia sakaeratensis NBRC 103193]
MHLLVIGGAGMIGRKFAESLAANPVLGQNTVTRLTLADVVPPQEPAGFHGDVTCLTADLSEGQAAEKLLSSRPDIVYHLAAIVSGEAEADFEKGYRINLDGTRNLFEAIRAANTEEGWCPRVVYASSNAVYGGDFPDVIPDDYILTPQTSYGTQKAIGELLLADYSRRGIFQGIGLRLPTICVRPGKPNRAASGFFSGIIREPLVGLDALLPVADTVRHWMTSPRSAIQFLRHAATLDLALVGDRPNLTMPALSVTVGEQIEALRKVAGDWAVAHIRRDPDPTIARIVDGWARAFEARRALSLGFTTETRFEDIIRAHIEDELDGRIA